MSENQQEASALLRSLYGVEPVSMEIINTSHGESDFREVLIATLASGERLVCKLADNDFTDPERIRMWQRTVEEYRRLGCYCPAILPDRTGGFPIVSYKDRRCVVYAEEYSRYPSAEACFSRQSAAEQVPPERYEPEVWRMTARVAAARFSYTDLPSGYCLFRRFCPSDPCDEVLENALEWKTLADALPEAFQPQSKRIWELWSANRSALEPLYRQLPTSVFQADLNPSNILVDEDGSFRGIYDFNLCGRDVFLNYLMRETLDPDPQAEREAIFRRLELVRDIYPFSPLEKQAALPLYRCLKPLWWHRLELLKKLRDDPAGLRALLDEVEALLTCDFDFASHMN